MQVETVSDKRFLQDKKTQGPIQNLHVVFAIASSKKREASAFMSVRLAQARKGPPTGLMCIQATEIAHTAQKSDEATERCDPHCRRMRKYWRL